VEKGNKFKIGMLLVAMGIVYGDIGTSPMYVMKSIVEGNGGIGQVDESFIIGSLSLLIWTITLLTTVKFVLIAMKADNKGEGGIFALFSLVKNYGKWLIIPAMLGGAALLADGVLTPAVTVTTAVEGLRSIAVMDRLLGSGQTKVVIITLLIISLLFAIQRAGTSTIGKAFGPVMLLWFGFLGVVGVGHIFTNPVVLKAFNPVYAIRVLISPNNKAGFMILGSVFLCTTGAEALYSDMGHVGKKSIYLSWPFVKLCLILNYLGQGAWIILNTTNQTLAGIEDMNPFYLMLPTVLRPFAVVLGALAAIIASQALITGSYTLVSEAIQLDLLPHLEIRYPSDTKGQIYINTVNRVLWIGCAIVVLYFRSGSRMETAYGLAITIAMLMTTVLLFEYLHVICHKTLLAWATMIIFGLIEMVFFISSLGKFVHGGYVSVILTLLLLLLMIIWYRGTQIENRFSKKLRLENYKSNLEKLRNDESIPMICHNLVYLDRSENHDMIDRDILYSILDKDYKRAQAYWFISVNVLDEPDTMTYHVETYGTDFIFRIRLDLGFKCSQKINVYLRQIVTELQASGELPIQDKKYSIYGASKVGTFKFCLLHRAVNSNSELSTMDEFIMHSKYRIRHAAGSKARWYGLDTSGTIIEMVPLITDAPASSKKIVRK